MRAVSTTEGSRGDVGPMVGLAVQSRALGADMRVCAPPDFAARRARVRVPLVPARHTVRPLMTGAMPRPAADLPPRAAALAAARFDTVAAAAEECDAPVATGVMPTGAWR